MKSAFPPDWSPKGHLLLSIQNIFYFFIFIFCPLYSLNVSMNNVKIYYCRKEGCRKPVLGVWPPVCVLTDALIPDAGFLRVLDTMKFGFQRALLFSENEAIVCKPSGSVELSGLQCSAKLRQSLASVSGKRTGFSFGEWFVCSSGQHVNGETSCCFLCIVYEPV